MSGLAPRLPLVVDEIDGAYALIKDYVDLVEQNFKMLLFTIPGEKMMNPDYGVGLRRYLFENMLSQTITQSKVKSRILSQATKYMPYINIDLILFSMLESEPNSIHIRIEYDIVPLNARRTFDIIEKVEPGF